MKQFWLWTALGLLACHPATAAERPKLVDSLPAETIAYVAIADYDDLLGRLERTSLGRLARDPQAVGFADHVIQSLLDYQFPASAAARERGQVGGAAEAWRESLSAQWGEVVFALVARDGDDPALIVLVDGGPGSGLVRRLLDSELRQAERLGLRRAEKAGQGELQIVERESDGIALVAFLTREDRFAICDDSKVLRNIARAWSESSTDTLPSHPGHKQWRARREATTDAADIEFFVDLEALVADAKPVAIEKKESDTVSADADRLSVSGVAGIGGSIEISRGNYDFLLNAEMLLEQPRHGLAKLIALNDRSLEVEPWVPHDVVSYSTIQWDIERTLLELSRLTEHHRPESATRWLAEQSGIQDERFANVAQRLTGRISQASWLLPTDQQPAAAQILALHVRSGGELPALLDALRSSQESPIRKVTYRGQTYSELASRNSPSGKPQPPTCFALVHDCLLIANRPRAIHAAIDAMQADGQRLADQLDYKLAASRAGRLAGDRPPGVIQFFRPAEILRHFHGLAASDDGRETLQVLARGNPLYRAILRAAEEHALPDVKLIDRYFAAVGAQAVDEGDAIRHTLFVPRRK
jgi:hypothetical protein